VLGHAAEPGAAERGEKAMLGRHFTPPTFSVSGFQNVWKLWDGNPKEKPGDYDAAFRSYYGLHPAPYPNNGYPMGLREAPGFFGPALSTDCLLCHGGSLLGRSYVGLPNASDDLQAFFEDMAVGDGRTGKAPFHFSNVRVPTDAG